MVLFKDIHKTAGDLVSKDFSHEKNWEAEIKSKADKFVFTQTAQVDAKKAFDATSSIKFAEKDVSVEAKFFANGNSTVDLKYTVPTFPKGLILNAKYDRKPKATDAFEVSSEYSHAAAHGKFSVFPLASRFAGSALFNVQSFKAGAEVEGKLDFNGVKYSVGASYAPSNNKYGASLKTVGDEKTAVSKLVAHGFYKKGSAEVGVEASYGVNSGSFAGSAGAKYEIDKKTFVKAKVSENGVAAFAVTQQIKDICSATFGLQVDAANIAHPESLRYGVKLNISH